jgi:hypothetical protein
MCATSVPYFYPQDMVSQEKMQPNGNGWTVVREVQSGSFLVWVFPSSQGFGSSRKKKCRGVWWHDDSVPRFLEKNHWKPSFRRPPIKLTFGKWNPSFQAAAPFGHNGIIFFRAKT